MTTATKPKGHTAVMAERRDPTDALDFFPTPPWATRALCEHVLDAARLEKLAVWEPAAGEGHMAEVLREYFGTVHASDVHDYGCGYRVGSFIGDGIDVLHMPCGSGPSWIITNPPFNLGEAFALKALATATAGVALLLRSVWMEGGRRWERIFSRTPPTIIAQFAERVPMVKGRWDPDGSTATSYAWFVWRQPCRGADYDTRFMWIPPGRRRALERADDRKRFADKGTEDGR